MTDDRRIPVILGARRTPIGAYLGSLAPLAAPRLGAIAIEAALAGTGIDPAAVDEVIMGNVLTAGEGQAPARQAALGAGLPDHVGALTINKVCGSGLKAVMLAAAAIRAGDGQIFVAGGMESMSQAPYYVPKARQGYRMGHGRLVDGMVHDGLWCATMDHHMGNSAEHIAAKFGVTREDQDRFALESHRKAVAAIDAGAFRREIVAVDVPQRKGDPRSVDQDESPRRDTSLEKLARLRPVFDPEGTVTAGNAPGLNDGAAAVVVTSLAVAKDLAAEPRARIVDYAQGALAPIDLFYAPVLAVRKLLEKTGWSLDEVDLIEANEAFAAQSLVDGRELGWDWDRVNVRGGAIALGHPIGASGARVLVTLLHALEDLGKRRGVATLCLGGGEAVALALDRHI